ncbi:MAG: hypothetical protein ACT4QC_17980 [Planctomycetaceae bacterium]
MIALHAPYIGVPKARGVSLFGQRVPAARSLATGRITEVQNRRGRKVRRVARRKRWSTSSGLLGVLGALVGATFRTMGCGKHRGAGSRLPALRSIPSHQAIGNSMALGWAAEGGRVRFTFQVDDGENDCFALWNPERTVPADHDEKLMIEPEK